VIDRYAILQSDIVYISIIVACNLYINKLSCYTYVWNVFGTWNFI
jgi:hypothetical protein